ncbi:MAG TPA: hypothetical protein VFM80_06020 [Gracilimonas sp.]|uniref:hypothetical protein n=1 Tax=Gracilimonas sp. TaxID=1974203 RepID=UPI002DAD3CB9|nr:hypothetical protein [Gracilimonas sp.]
MERLKKTSLLLISSVILTFGFSMVNSSNVKANMDPPNCAFSPIDKECHTVVATNCLCGEVTPDPGEG